jgi:hypothetical protein
MQIHPVGASLICVDSRQMDEITVLVEEHASMAI